MLSVILEVLDLNFEDVEDRFLLDANLESLGKVVLNLYFKLTLEIIHNLGGVTH